MEILKKIFIFYICTAQLRPQGVNVGGLLGFNKLVNRVLNSTSVTTTLSTEVTLVAGRVAQAVSLSGL